MTAPDQTPHTVWICTHVGEYGSYYPESVEAESEYGGQAVQYTRAPLAEALAVPTCDRPFIMGANHGYDTALEQVAELLEAMKEVLRISDRDHAAWHRAHAALRAIGERADG